MNVKTVAQEALGQLMDKSDCFRDGTDHAALIGYLEGVVAGNITVGQAWVGNTLRRSETVEYVDRLRLGTFDEALNAVIRKVFSSGMCCEGQALEVRLNRGGSVRR